MIRKKFREFPGFTATSNPKRLVGYEQNGSGYLNTFIDLVAGDNPKLPLELWTKDKTEEAIVSALTDFKETYKGFVINTAVSGKLNDNVYINTIPSRGIVLTSGNGGIVLDNDPTHSNEGFVAFRTNGLAYHLARIWMEPGGPQAGGLKSLVELTLPGKDTTDYIKLTESIQEGAALSMKSNNLNIEALDTIKLNSRNVRADATNFELITASEFVATAENALIYGTGGLALQGGNQLSLYAINTSSSIVLNNEGIYFGGLSDTKEVDKIYVTNKANRVEKITLDDFKLLVGGGGPSGNYVINGMNPQLTIDSNTGITSQSPMISLNSEIVSSLNSNQTVSLNVQPQSGLAKQFRISEANFRFGGVDEATTATHVYVKDSSNFKEMPLATLASLIGGGGDLHAENVMYDIPEYDMSITNVKEALDRLFDELYYQPIKIESFPGGGNYEIGIVLSPMVLTWVLNKEAKTQTMNGNVVPVDQTEYIIENSISGNRDFNLIVSDGRTSDSRTVQFRFHRAYFSNAVLTIPTTNAQVRAMNKTLANSKTFTITTGTSLLNFVFAIPSTTTVKSVIDTGNMNVDITSAYQAVGTVEVTDASLYLPQAIPYTIYALTVATPYDVSTNHVVTLN